MQTLIGTDLAEAKKYLEQGLPVGLPTETVYGLGANALNENAVLQIFSVKDRPHFDPLIVHVHSPQEIEKYVTEIPDKAQQLIAAFMPGPLTVLLKKKNIIPDIVTSGLNTVALRVPKHPVMLELLQRLAFPLAAPSANPFGYISPTTAQHVYNQLQNKIAYVVDGGPAAVGVESTIIGFDKDEPVLYRLGGLPIEEIENIIGKVQLSINENSNPKSPGMLQSHYAPKKKLSVQLFETINTVKSSGNIGVIAFNEYVEVLDKKNQILLSPSGDLNEAAKNLFSALRKLDDSEVEKIIAVKFPEIGLGRAINDRLRRASA